MCAGTRQDTCQDGGMRTKRSNTQSGHDLAARVPALAVAEGGVAVAAGSEGSALVEHLLERDEVANVGELHQQIEPTVRRYSVHHIEGWAAGYRSGVAETIVFLFQEGFFRLCAQSTLKLANS